MMALNMENQARVKSMKTEFTRQNRSLKCDIEIIDLKDLDFNSIVPKVSLRDGLLDEWFTHLARSHRKKTTIAN